MGKLGTLGKPGWVSSGIDMSGMFSSGRFGRMGIENSGTLDSSGLSFAAVPGISGSDIAEVSCIFGLVKSAVLGLLGLSNPGILAIVESMSGLSSINGRGRPLMFGLPSAGLRGIRGMVETLGRCGFKFNLANSSWSSSSNESASDCSAKSEVKNGPCGIISNRMKEVGEGSSGFRSELNLVKGVDEGGGGSDDEVGGDAEPNDGVESGISSIPVVVVDVEVDDEGGEGRVGVESGWSPGLLNRIDPLKGLNLTKGGVVGTAFGCRDVILVGRGLFFLRMKGLLLTGGSE